MFDIRPLGPDDIAEALQVTTTALLQGQLSATDLERRSPLWQLSRSLGAVEHGRIIGHVRALPLETTVPGGARVATAGISNVGVLPTHTRRGVLRALKTAQLHQERAAGAVLASLRASEAAIYGRFGYGLGGLAAHLEIEPRRGAFNEAGNRLAAAGSVALLTPAEAIATIPEVYERVGRAHVGAIGRLEPWWPDRVFGGYGTPADSSARWVAVHRSDGAPSAAAGPTTGATTGALVDGYVDYEVASPGALPARITVRDLFATSPEAYAALWRYLLDVDLASTISARMRPIDEALRWLLIDPRALKVTEIVDEQWVRLLDVAAALGARTYGPGDAVAVAVRDELFADNSGIFRVSTAGVERLGQDVTADLEVGVADAGAAYLGGTSFAELARAGRVVERVGGAADAADRLFAVCPLPWCGTFF